MARLTFNRVAMSSFESQSSNIEKTFRSFRVNWSNPVGCALPWAGSDLIRTERKERAPGLSETASDRVSSHYRAVAAGVGLAVLPMFLARHDKNLVRVLPEEAELKRTFWLVCEEEIRYLNRVRTAWDLLKQAVAEGQSDLNPGKDAVSPGRSGADFERADKTTGKSRRKTWAVRIDGSNTGLTLAEFSQRGEENRRRRRERPRPRRKAARRAPESGR